LREQPREVFSRLLLVTFIPEIAVYRVVVRHGYLTETCSEKGSILSGLWLLGRRGH
jgi:hypothetical protein